MADKGLISLGLRGARRPRHQLKRPIKDRRLRGSRSGCSPTRPISRPSARSAQRGRDGHQELSRRCSRASWTARRTRSRSSTPAATSRCRVHLQHRPFLRLHLDHRQPQGVQALPPAQRGGARRDGRGDPLPARARQAAEGRLDAEITSAG
jgi:hypothetical protein